MGQTLRLCSQCERQCSWYTQPQPPKLSMHGETCVPVLPHWLPVGRGSAPVRKGRNRGAGREGGGRRRTGKVAEVVERRTAERENGGGWMREVRGVRRETETGGGRWAGGGRRVRGGERSRCGRWEACEGGARTFLDQQAPTDRARARWLCACARRSRWCVPQPLARALRGRLDTARLVGATLTGPLHATHARARPATSAEILRAYKAPRPACTRLGRARLVRGRETANGKCNHLTCYKTPTNLTPRYAILRINIDSAYAYFAAACCRRSARPAESSGLHSALQRASGQ